MGFEDRKEHIGEIVARYFICGLGARDAVPISFTDRYTRVSVHWENGSRWNVLCVPDFFPALTRPSAPAADKIRHYRMSLANGSEPVVARVRAQAVELSGKDGFPLGAFDLPRAA